MNYIQIDEYDTANGLGIGSVLWVSGCVHNCYGCHNPQTHNPNNGKPFTVNTLQELLNTLNKPYISRLTITGGDPLYIDNRVPIFQIIFTVKLHYPKIKIWLYTGYKYEEIKDLLLIKLVDVLVDGKFELSKKDLNLKFCGSSNQRVLYLRDGSIN